MTGLENKEEDQLPNFTVFSSNEDPSSNGDPTSYEEAFRSEVWRKSMDSETESIEKNDTWELTTLPRGLKIHWSKMDLQNKVQ